jgi:hypothetical protein
VRPLVERALGEHVATSEKTENTLRTGERPPLAPAHFTPPRIESWLVIMLSGFIPIGLIPFVPESARTLVVVLAAAPLAVGLAILLVKHWPKN